MRGMYFSTNLILVNAVNHLATTTASSSKILDIGSESHPDILSGYRLMDVNILDGIFNCLWLVLNVMKLKHFIWMTQMQRRMD